MNLMMISQQVRKIKKTEDTEQSQEEAKEEIILPYSIKPLNIKRNLYGRSVERWKERLYDRSY